MEYQWNLTKSRIQRLLGISEEIWSPYTCFKRNTNIRASCKRFKVSILVSCICWLLHSTPQKLLRCPRSFQNTPNHCSTRSWALINRPWRKSPHFRVLFLLLAFHLCTEFRNWSELNRALSLWVGCCVDTLCVKTDEREAGNNTRGF